MQLRTFRKFQINSIGPSTPHVGRELPHKAFLVPHRVFLSQYTGSIQFFRSLQLSGTKEGLGFLYRRGILSYPRRNQDSLRTLHPPFGDLTPRRNFTHTWGRKIEINSAWVT